ncbi:MAG: GH3 auxin-responsive promoter family protein [Planctomyces sp.]|nr:GH3 auxin-responsive promoter family protein [Planctomyces sp.]
MNRFPLLNQVRAVAGGMHRRSTWKRRESFLDTARRDCLNTQRATLRGLLELNRESDFAKDFRLSPDLTAQEFRKRVPVAGYELVQPYIEKMKSGHHQALLGRKNKLLMYAMTSGTTADSKLIPVTERFLSDYRRGWQSWGIGAYRQHADLKLLHIIQISSSHRRSVTADGTPCGNISGLVAAMQGKVVRSLYTIPSEVAEIFDADAKRYAVLRLALADPLAGMLITANPSTVLQMLETLQLRASDLIRDIHDGGLSGSEAPQLVLKALARSLRPNRDRAKELERFLSMRGKLQPSDFWPHLQTLGVWRGGSAAAYIPTLNQWFPGVAVRDHGLHASEGRMTMPVNEESPAGVLEIETHYFEFLPVDAAGSQFPETLEAHELKEGSEYYILLTTSSGFCRYNIQDVVRCVGFHGATPMLEFRHKGAHISSITGEKIAESQVVDAVRSAAETSGVPLRYFTLTPSWGNPPGYVLYALPAGSEQQTAFDPSALQKLATLADSNLKHRNSEYLEKRDTGRLAPIRCEFLPASHWDKFTIHRTRRSGGSIEQYKHPCLLPDPQFEDLFRKACGLTPLDR